MSDFSWAKTDCRRYVGEKPCAIRRFGCEGCGDYDPMGTRALVIKLAAMGDVLRTTPLLDPIRAAHERTHVTWVVDPQTAPLLRGVPGIDLVVEMDAHTAAILDAQEFDELYCLDKEPRAIALSARVRARKKKGFTMTSAGTLSVHDGDAAYALRLGIDDELKFFVNQKTYQQIIFEACGFRFADEPLRIGITDDERAEGRAFLAGLGPGPHIGINTGAGDAFATKRLPEKTTAELAVRIRREFGFTPVLLGGPGERDRNIFIRSLAGSDLVDVGSNHPVRRFASIVSGLSALVCVDTLAMHIAIAERLPVVAIFGPTCAQEVHLYGRGKKLVQSPWCAPCYKSACVHHTCMNDVRVDDLLDLLRGLNL